jgi:hypothetical protein
MVAGNGGTMLSKEAQICIPPFLIMIDIIWPPFPAIIDYIWPPFDFL